MLSNRVCNTSSVQTLTFSVLKFKFALAVSPATFRMRVWTWGGTQRTFASLPGFPEYECWTVRVTEHSLEKNDTVGHVI